MILKFDIAKEWGNVSVRLLYRDRSYWLSAPLVMGRSQIRCLAWLQFHIVNLKIIQSPTWFYCDNYDWRYTQFKFLIAKELYMGNADALSRKTHSESCWYCSRVEYPVAEKAQYSSERCRLFKFLEEKSIAVQKDYN